MCYERRRAEALVDFGGLVCPSRTSERGGGKGYCVKGEGGGEEEREQERALGLSRETQCTLLLTLLFHNPLY
jgi:hypothetical protein